MTDEIVAAINAKLMATKAELEAMGAECVFVWRCPSGAKNQVGHLFVAQTYEDVQAARDAGFGGGARPTV